MQLIKTDDGLIGIQFNKDQPAIWVDTVEQAATTVHANDAKRLGHSAMPYPEVHKEIALAVDEMSSQGHTIAEFGVLGYFLFSKTDEANDEASF